MTGTAASVFAAEPDETIEISEPAPSAKAPAGRTLVIGCGALARELLEIVRVNRLEHIDVTCLPAIWHNRPERIPEGVRAKIRAAKAGEKGRRYERILIAYGDCGTGGKLDRIIEEEGVERLPGAHCYAFYAGLEAFDAMAEEELGTFYLTDYLVRFFDRLIMEGLGIDRHPELLPLYFGNYKRLVYLAQIDDPALDRTAEAAAAKLGLAYEKRRTGFGLVPGFLGAVQPSATDAPHEKEEARWPK